MIVAVLGESSVSLVRRVSVNVVTNEFVKC